MHLKNKKHWWIYKPAFVMYGYLTVEQSCLCTHARYPGLMTGRAARLVNYRPLFALAPEEQSPCQNCHQFRGKLLPYPFTLTCVIKNNHRRFTLCCLFLRLPSVGVTHIPALWWPDFPHVIKTRNRMIHQCKII